MTTYVIHSAALAATLALVSGCASSHSHSHSHSHAHRGPSQHRFEDAEKWARVFEDPARDEWQKPDEVIAALDLPENARVADIGAATGYFPVRIARSHPNATVYGVDVEPDMVAFLRERAEREGLANLRAVQGDPSDPNLPEPADLVLLVNTYHHISERPAYFSRLASKLLPGGRIAIVDFRPGAEFGPPEDHKLAPERVIEEMKAAGYRLVATHDFLPHQYFLVFGRG